MRKQPRTVLYDRMHKGIVWVCIGLTLYGTILVGDRIYRYVKHVRPGIQATKTKAEEELLAEGSSEKL